ncbi:MAG: hypothetical protein CVV23_07875 [Ignavibacteriae bacterium HGW-Ignavibacteriae-2]|jgi:hypothetical protein|nr:DUF5362 domain-containing protein [Bacteroidota bacterium]PKL88921.1 MAG: hypothetical protein CVV23_07875 [Ignavibacteriae bacterium HGW-Ignavibacteriae-2]
MEDFNGIKIENGNLDPDIPQKPVTGFGLLFNSMTSNMKFVGMFSIIYGAFTCITIIGALIGVPMIIAGLRLREAADDFTIFQSTSDNHALRNAFEKQGKFFNIVKILIIVSLVLVVIYIIVIVILGIYIFGSATGYENY